MKGATILIVEDEVVVARDLQASLRQMGFTVAAPVVSGMQAIARVAEARPDLVMMDITLKGEMDGVEAAKVIGERYDVPVVFLTAHSDRETVDRVRTLTRPSGYLVKPYNTERLRESIATALASARGGRSGLPERAARRSILVVDSSNYAQAAVTRLLGKTHKVKLSPSIEHAREMLRSASFDLVVMDIGLPGARGGAVIREWRRDMNVQVPIIVLTERITPEVIAYLESEIVSGFVVKTPDFGPRLLVEVDKVLP